MKYKENESLLLDMICESNEEVRNTLYAKYEPTIKYIVKKYTKTALQLGLDYSDLIQEANVAFTDALNNYNQDKEASLKTFVSICVERRLINIIEKAKTGKNKLILESLSLDYDYNKEGLPLKEVIGDIESDPLIKYSEEERLNNLKDMIKDSLSELEIGVYSYMINDLNYIEIANILDKSPKQIDNTMQRVRTKVKNLLSLIEEEDKSE